MTGVSSPAYSAGSSALPDLVMDEPVINDFSDLFDFESAAEGDADVESQHSPTTISPNHTPSPIIAAHDPIARSPSPHPFGLGFSDIQVKEEPMDFGFGYHPNDLMNNPPRQSPLPVAPVAPELPVDMSFSKFPQDQQAALQQLMLNLFEYQTNFGPVDGTPAPTQPTTIEPSLVFSSSPTTSFAPSTSNASASGSGSGSASGNQTRSFVSPAPLTSINENEEELEHDEHDDDETLQTVSPYEQASGPIAGPSRGRARQTSVFSSTDDLDSRLDRLAPRDSIFSAGKGKGGKKGGGLSSVVRGDDEDLDDDDSWRPSPEEYKKLSSKEKRQLRNKLSARAFRTRRKDYIGTLEGHIKDRDDVIDDMRSELINFRAENQDLRRELEALKASTMKIIHPETANTNTQVPALMNALALPSRSETPNTPKRSVSSAPTPTFNPHKDIASSTTQASRGFWGNDNMFGGGSTICHHTFTPPPVFPRVNLNPLLNENGADRHQSAQHANTNANSKDLSQPFSEWSSNTDFNLRSMDAYRMQMWSRLTREAQAERDNIPQDLRPKFYVDPKSTTSTPSPTTSNAEATLAAQLAGAATNHITSKLASSFWSAFGGPTSLDTDKLAAVVTGHAKLAVVPTASSPHTQSGTGMSEKTPANMANMGEDDGLSHLMLGLKLQAHAGRDAQVQVQARPKVRENPLGAITTFIKHASGVPARA